MNGDIRSENGLGSMGLEVTSAQGEGEGKEEANIRWVDREEMAAKLWSGISSLRRPGRSEMEERGLRGRDIPGNPSASRSS